MYTFCALTVVEYHEGIRPVKMSVGLMLLMTWLEL